MFGLFKSKPKGEKFDFSLLKTDMHSHILPGIDDGADNLETSLALIRGMEKLGYKKLIATPHIMWDMYRNTPDIIQQKLDLVRRAVKVEGLDIEISAAAEYFLDEHVEDLLKNKEPMLTVSGNKVLVEFSMAFPSMNIKSILFEMQLQGYQPVIAHPERYTYLMNDKKFYDELNDIGCLFQLNILALGGYYGKTVHELALYLLKNNFYSLAGTDLHHAVHLEALSDLLIPTQVYKLLEKVRFENNLL
jgi:tyrosine-protein phosphatase YwqE